VKQVATAFETRLHSSKHRFWTLSRYTSIRFASIDIKDGYHYQTAADELRGTAHSVGHLSKLQVLEGPEAVEGATGAAGALTDATLYYVPT
jgi:hypothetical protein